MSTGFVRTFDRTHIFQIGEVTAGSIFVSKPPKVQETLQREKVKVVIRKKFYLQKSWKSVDTKTKLGKKWSTVMTLVLPK